LKAKIDRGFVEMISKWILIPAIVLALLFAGGSCSGLPEDTFGYTSPGSTSSAASVAGSWSLTLLDAAGGWTRSLNLDIAQIDDVIFGQGSSEDGGAGAISNELEPRPTEDEGIESMIWWLHQDPEPVAPTTTSRSLTIGASGQVSGTSLDLDLIFLEENVLYRLDLNAVGSSISGSYQAYDYFGRVRSGSCNGYLMAGRGLSVGSSPSVIPLGGMRSY
jgi:hypothetical protein